MKEDNPEAAATRLGLKQVSNSNYYYEKPNGQDKSAVVYWEDGEFYKITECTARNSLMPPIIYIASLDALYLSCNDGQRLINRNGTILSAPRDFYAINCCREGDITKKTALLNVTDHNGSNNAVIVKDVGNDEYKWGLLFPRDNKGFIFLDGNGGSVFIKKGDNVLFLKTLVQTRAYSYKVPLTTKGSPSVVFLQKNDDYNRKLHEYQVWEDGNFAWSFDINRVISRVEFLHGHPFVAHIRCNGREGLLDLKSREIILLNVYKKITVEENDFAYAITLDGHRCLYDISERKWVVAESDGWVGSKKRKQYRIFTSESKRAVFYYGSRELHERYKIFQLI